MIAIHGKQLQLQARDAGTYTATTSTGRTGSATLQDPPATQTIPVPWRLEFPPDRGAPASTSLDQLADWTTHNDPGIRYFSGTATYHNQFTIDAATSARIANGARIELNLGTVREVATVTLNGKDVGTLWKTPYRIDITGFLKPGKNQLTVGVTNTWNNRLVGDAQRDDDTDITRTNMHDSFKANSPLLPSGLIGPVTLETSMSGHHRPWRSAGRVTCLAVCRLINQGFDHVERPAMKMMNIALPMVLCGLALCGPLAAAPKVLPNPDFTKGESIPEGAVQDYNLGATGARGWMHSDKLATVEARQVYITKVAAGFAGRWRAEGRRCAARSRWQTVLL